MFACLAKDLMNMNSGFLQGGITTLSQRPAAEVWARSASARAGSCTHSDYAPDGEIP